MRAEESMAALAAMSGADQAGVQLVSEEWFVEICRALLGKDAGYALHKITGFEERSCYRYAAGDRKPPAFFLRALLRSEQGGQFLEAVMDGAAPEWWSQHISAKRDADLARAFAEQFVSR